MSSSSSQSSSSNNNHSGSNEQITDEQRKKLLSNDSMLMQLQEEVQKLQQSGVKGDLNAILQRITTLHEQNQRLRQEMEEKDQRIGKLESKTQEEMNKKLELILPYVRSLIEKGLPQPAAESMESTLNKIIKHTAEDSGIWQVLCTASAVSANNANEMERLRQEANALRDRMGGGVFGSESSRMEEDNGKKRKHDVISSDDSVVKSSIWDDFEASIKSENGVRS